MFESDHANPRAILAAVALFLQEQGERSKPPCRIAMVLTEPRQRSTKPKEGQTAFVVDRFAQGSQILRGLRTRAKHGSSGIWGQPVAKVSGELPPGNFDPWDSDQVERRGRDFESNQRHKSRRQNCLRNWVTPLSLSLLTLPLQTPLPAGVGGVISWIGLSMPTICLVTPS